MIDQQTILVIDDELQIRRLLEIALSAKGYNVAHAATGHEGMVVAATLHPSLIILDLGLPDNDGQVILQDLRRWFSKPIIILSVRNAEPDIIQALDNGANDYLTKPFRSGELLARIRAAIRLAEQQSDQPVFTFGTLSIDMVNHIVKKADELIKLTSTEYALLCLLVKNSGRVLTHQFILKEIWGYSYMEQTQYLRVYVAQLRKKIEQDPARPTFLMTESGIGYRFGE
jgi:two-component system KDP operon response regulator KdpE